MRFAIAILLSLDVHTSAYLASLWHGVPYEDLIAICKRESNCTRIGIHEIDAHLDGYGGQVRLGHLNPACQKRGRKAQSPWTTRGSFGLSAASHWQYMPPCYQPEWFDYPFVSAMVAGAKYKKVCTGTHPTRWCPKSVQNEARKKRARKERRLQARAQVELTSPTESGISQT